MLLGSDTVASATVDDEGGTGTNTGATGWVNIECRRKLCRRGS